MVFRCSANRKFPVDSERDWDGSAAKDRLFKHYGWTDEGPPNDSGGDVRQAFLLFDDEKPNVRGSYKLPFCDEIGGTVKALASGLRAAASRLPQTDGASDEEKNSARDVLDNYFSKLHENDDEEASRSGLMLARMDIRKSTGPTHTPGAQLPAELIRQMYDPAALDDTPPFLFTAAASTGQVDSYNTRMLPSSLRNFAEDAQTGLSLQNSHKVEELPFGRTYDGRYMAGQDRGGQRSEFDIYMPRGLNLNGVATDDVIRGIRAGVIRDVSVGFYGGQIRCSLCGKEMMTDLFGLLWFGFPEDEESRDQDAPCYHLPGLEYPERDKKGNVTDTRVTAIGEIDAAHCAELSLVFDGATPGAAIINGRRCVAMAKAEQMAQIGVLPRHTASRVMTRFRNTRSAAIENVLSRRFSGYHAPSTPAPETERESSEDLEVTYTESRMPGASTETRSTEVDATSAETRGELTTDPVEPTGATPEIKVGLSIEGPVDDGLAERVSAIVSQQLAAHLAAARGEESTTPGGRMPRNGHTQDDDVVEENTPSSGEATRTLETDETETRRAPANTPTGTGSSDRASVSSSQTDSRATVASPSASDVTERMRTAMRQAQLVPEDWQGDPMERIRALGTEVRDLRSWATIGESARAELVTTIEAEGVRAYGAEGLPPAVYGRLLETGTWSELTGLRDHLRHVAVDRFPGGRRTTEEADQPLEDQSQEPEPLFETERPAPPVSVFQARY